MQPRAQDILRYWLAAIRTEEALSLRVRAERPRRNRRLDMLDPGRGQTYFKLLGEDAAAFLLRRKLQIQREVSEDRLGFLEHTLREAYRRQRWVRNNDEDPPPLVVGFPVVLDRRRGELRTLLRFELEGLVWRDAVDQAWKPPTARERSGGVPVPPRLLQLTADVAPEDELPFTVDEDLLSRALGIPDEQIGHFLRRVAAEGVQDGVEMTRWVHGLLTSQDPGESVEPTSEDEPQALLAQLSQAVGIRLNDSSRRVWPIGLVYDGGMVFATHYLQQDLRELVTGRAELRPTSPLDRYLHGKARTPQRRAHVGCRPGRRLTDSQRDVAERFLGSGLTAAQGPPGTGKTELILALCAQTLIERMGRAAMSATGRVSMSPQLVVASTNNRAVDNVIDPLSEDPERLPIALRLGSRIVVEQVTVPMLRNAAHWLRRADSTTAADILHEEQLRLESAMEALKPIEKAWRQSEISASSLQASQTRVARLEKELAATQEKQAADPRDDETRTRELSLAQGAAQSITELEKKLRAVVSQLPIAPRKRRQRAVNKCWKSLSPPATLELKLSLATLGIPFEAPEAPVTEEPELAEQIESLEEAAALLNELGEAVEDRLEELAELDLEALSSELEEARAQLTQLETEALANDDTAALASLADTIQEIEPGLAEAAQRMREAWAVENRHTLIPALERVADELESTRSPRRVALKHASEWGQVLRLFPVFGCTLLSMGNAFPMEDKALGRLVIDEAGQCHPAHAVSALVRCERALVIGDVHQLEPVIGLDDWDEARVRRRIDSPLEGEALLPFRTLSAGGTSAQSLAERACSEVPALLDHYRCQEAIIGVNQTLAGYRLNILTQPASLDEICPLLHAPLLGFDVRGEQVAWHGSWRNDAEVSACVRLVARMRSAGLSASRIAVLTPYRAQLYALEQGLRAAGVRVDDGNASEAADGLQSSLLPELMLREESGVTIGTVHRFQGGERDVVILSTAVSRERSLAFTNARVNLLNVAISRAKLHLLLVGNREVLSNGRYTKMLVDAIPPGAWT